MKTIKVCNIVFLQGEESIEPLEIYKNEGINKLFDYLYQWEYGTENEHTIETLQQCRPDDNFTLNKHGLTYYISINENLSYIGMSRKVEL